MISLRMRPRTVVLLFGTLAALTLASGCNDTSTSAEMTCKEFMSLSSEDQQSAWVSVADAAKRPEVATGGGMLNGLSVCQDSPEQQISDVASKVSPY